MGQFSMEKSSPPGSVLSGNQHDGGDKGRGGHRAEAWDRRQPTRRFILLRPADELGVERGDPPVEFRPLRARRR